MIRLILAPASYPGAILATLNRPALHSWVVGLDLPSVSRPLEDLIAAAILRTRSQQSSSVLAEIVLVGWNLPVYMPLGASWIKIHHRLRSAVPQDLLFLELEDCDSDSHYLHYLANAFGVGPANTRVNRPLYSAFREPRNIVLSA